MSEEKIQQWSRFHQNGMVANVIKAPYFEDGYAVGATRSQTAGTMEIVRGFENAKKVADARSGCPQPCTCAPWS